MRPARRILSLVSRRHLRSGHGSADDHLICRIAEAVRLRSVAAKCSHRNGPRYRLADVVCQLDIRQTSLPFRVPVCRTRATPKLVLRPRIASLLIAFSSTAHQNESLAQIAAWPPKKRRCTFMLKASAPSALSKLALHSHHRIDFHIIELTFRNPLTALDA